MRSARFNGLTSTALALILASVAIASAEPYPTRSRYVQEPMPGAASNVRSGNTTRQPVAPPSAMAQSQSQSQARPRTETRRNEPAMAQAAGQPNKSSAGPAAPLSSHPAAEKLRELITGKRLERIVSRKNERDAVIAFYQGQRGFAPLWLGSDGDERAKDVLAFLHGVDADGLEPTDYPMPDLNETGADAQAEAEVKFTATLLAYARHALNGRVHFSRISKDIEYKDKFDPADVLKKIAASRDLTQTLEQFNPHQPAYLALKAKFAEMRNQTDEEQAAIPSGPALKYGGVDKKGKEALMSDARVPLLRERLGLPEAADSKYDKPLAEAVAKFQKAHGIKPDGVLASATLAAMNPPNREQRMGAILATMERWRWMPRDLGKTHVVLNIPDYFLRVYNNGSQVWMTKVVVGKVGKETPLLTETMKFITVNPTWNVPQSIIYNELLPVYETSDPNIFEKMGLKVERNGSDIRVFQPPGERNALGQIRFNFPNKFLVYQHDTPDKNYFNPDKRAYSHGCMRVQDPMKYAEVILSFASPKLNYTAENVRKMLGGEEKQIDFVNQIPVHVTYQTAFVDDNGKLQYREDIYGLDAKIQSELKGSERQMADVVMERPADPNFKPDAAAMARMRNAAGGGSPFAMFEQLFR